MARMLDGPTLETAFEELGRALARRRTKAEITVYGGSAILLQFDFRTGTFDTDARIVTGHGAVVDAQKEVAKILGLPPGWLNEQVTPYLSQTKDQEGQIPFGTYPSFGSPWLTVSVAKPEYLLALKLTAARPGTADLSDAVELAAETGLSTADALAALVTDYYPHHRLDTRTRTAIEEVAAAVALRKAGQTGETGR